MCLIVCYRLKINMPFHMPIIWGLAISALL